MAAVAREALLGPKAALVVAGVGAGLLLRVYVLRSNLGALDSDEAVLGLMVLHVLEGELSVFYWLQAYTGFQTPYLLVPVLAVLGAHALALKLFAIAGYGVAALLVWRVGRHTVGEDAAWLGALLFWTWPPFLVWWSTRSYLYEEFLLWGLAALLLALRLHANGSRRDAALLGLVLGFGWWASPQVFLLALPAVGWLIVRRRDVLRHAPLAAALALVAATPWIAWNARHNWLSLRLRPEPGASSSFAERVETLFADVIPTWLGLRVPLSLEWTFGPVVGVAVVAVALAYVVSLLVRRPPRLEPLLVVLAAFPLMYLASSFSYYAAAPKYLVVVAPVPALLLGRLFAGRARAALALVAAAALSFTGVRAIEDTRMYAAHVPNVLVPKDISPLIDVLERERAHRVFAHYWLAYRITFESDERIVATPTGFVRYLPHDRLVRASPSPAYAFVRGSTDETDERARLQGRGYRRIVADAFVVYLVEP